MPASPVVASTQRGVHVRRARMRRDASGSAAAEGNGSGGDDGEGKGGESEVAAAAAPMSSNRFAILRPNEPAPGTQEGCSDAGHLPVTFLAKTGAPLANQKSLREKSRDESLLPTSSAIPCSKAPVTPGLLSQATANSTRTSVDISCTRPQALPSPLALQLNAQSRESSRPSSASARSPDFDTADPYLSLLAPDPPATLPPPPVPPDPMAIPCLATLPIDPSLDFRFFTDPKPPGPKFSFPHLKPPSPTSYNVFPSDDPLQPILRTTSGKIFSIAAEIAAVNSKSKLKPVGMFLFATPEKMFGKVKGSMDGKKTRRSKRKSQDSTQKEDESEDDGEGGEGWLGKDERFWK